MADVCMCCSRSTSTHTHAYTYRHTSALGLRRHPRNSLSLFLITPMRLRWPVLRRHRRSFRDVESLHTHTHTHAPSPLLLSSLTTPQPPCPIACAPCALPRLPALHITLPRFHSPCHVCWSGGEVRAPAQGRCAMCGACLRGWRTLRPSGTPPPGVMRWECHGCAAWTCLPLSGAVPAMLWRRGSPHHGCGQGRGASVRIFYSVAAAYRGGSLCETLRHDHV